jgi:hypothetical protein
MPAGRLAQELLLVYCYKEKGGETGMKKIMSASVLVKEAALWGKLKESVRKHPATVCHK